MGRSSTIIRLRKDVENMSKIYRRREERMKWTVYLKVSTIKRLEKLVEKSSYYKSDVIDVALEEYVEKLEKEAENGENN